MNLSNIKYSSTSWIICNYMCFVLMQLLDEIHAVSATKPDIQLNQSERILSRKRRYLIFPSGSSLQLAYDADLYIPDFENYLETGCTVGIAWPLPDQPVYPEDSLMIQHRNDEYVPDPSSSNTFDKKKTSTTSAPSNKLIDNPALMNFIHLLYDTAHKSSLTNNTKLNFDPNINQFDKFNYIRNNNYRRNDSDYFRNTQNVYRIPVVSSANDQYFNVNKGNNGKIKNYTNNNGYAENTFNIRPALSPAFHTNFHNNNERHYQEFTNYLMQTYVKPWMESDRFNSATTIKPYPMTPPVYKPKINTLHAVYPAMRKRRISNLYATYEDKFYLDHHRNTRHEVYNIIEKFLYANGHNTECLLKTLCQVGQKRNENDPGSFLAEIIRVIFSLPEAQLKRVVEKRHINYDLAYRTNGNCTEKFSNCPHSVWDARFLIETYDS